MGQISEVSPTPAKQDPVKDPSICPEDFFHVSEGPDEESEESGFDSPKTLGIYTVTPTNHEITDFLRRVAIS
jgi:hypothetical protein